LLNVIMLNVIYTKCHIQAPYAECRLLNVIMLSVIYTKCHIQVLYAVSFAEWHYAECRGTDQHSSLPRYGVNLKLRSLVFAFCEKQICDQSPKNWKISRAEFPTFTAAVDSV
jgi:hypothetical protein